MLTQEELRTLLLWQEGLLCSLCLAAELVTPAEVESTVCDECRADIERLEREN